MVSPLEAIGAIVALGLMGGGLKLYQMNRKKSMKIEQPPSPRIIDEAPKPESKPEVAPSAPIVASEKKATPQKRKKRKNVNASKRRNRK